MRTEMATLIETSAPARPACFRDDETWKSWLMSAHESGISIVRRSDLGKSRGNRQTHYALLQTNEINYCVECPAFHMRAMKARGHCRPSRAAINELARGHATLQPAGGPMPDTNELPSFAFKGKACIQHLNVRKEGAEDDRELAVDIKINGRTDGKVCAFFDPGLHGFLFDHAGIARNPMLEPVSFGNEIRDCTVSIAGMRLTGARLSKFRLSPVDGRIVNVTFSASINPTKDEVAILAEYVGEEAHVEAMPAPELFTENATADTEAYV